MRTESAFLEIVGDTPFTRLVDFLITGRNFDYTLTELSKKAGVSWTTLSRIFPKLIERRIVLQVRQVGMAKLYKLNMENPLALKLVDIYQIMLSEKLAAAAKRKVVVEA